MAFVCLYVCSLKTYNDYIKVRGDTMAIGRNHALSMRLESLCRTIFAKGKDLSQVDRSVVGSSMDANSIDNFNLKHALCVAFAPHFHDLNSDDWNKVEALLDKYTTTIFYKDDLNYEEYNKVCEESLEETKELAKELNLIR